MALGRRERMLDVFLQTPRTRFSIDEVGHASSVVDAVWLVG